MCLVFDANAVNGEVGKVVFALATRDEDDVVEARLELTHPAAGMVGVRHERACFESNERLGVDDRLSFDAGR